MPLLLLLLLLVLEQVILKGKTVEGSGRSSPDEWLVCNTTFAPLRRVVDPADLEPLRRVCSFILRVWYTDHVVDDGKGLLENEDTVLVASSR